MSNPITKNMNNVELYSIPHMTFVLPLLKLNEVTFNEKTFWSISIQSMGQHIIHCIVWLGYNYIITKLLSGYLQVYFILT